MIIKANYEYRNGSFDWYIVAWGSKDFRGKIDDPFFTYNERQSKNKFILRALMPVVKGGKISKRWNKSKTICFVVIDFGLKTKITRSDIAHLSRVERFPNCQ